MVRTPKQDLIAGRYKLFLNIFSEFLDKMRKSIEVAEFQLISNIITEQDQIVWESMGLTSDQQTMENAAILSKVMNPNSFKNPAFCEFHLHFRYLNFHLAHLQPRSCWILRVVPFYGFKNI